MPRRVTWSLARRIRAAVAPPQQSSAPESWAAHSVHVLGLGFTLGLTIAIVHNTMVGRRHAAAALAIELSIVGLVLALNRRGRTDSAARLLAASVPVLATALMLVGYGMRDVAALLLTASLVVCGLLLDAATLAGVALLTAACAAGMNAAEAYGLLPTPQAPFPWLRQSLDASIIVGVTALGVRLIAVRLRQSYEALRRDQAALRRSEERYRSLIELAADAICIRAEDGTVLEANSRASELTGYARDQLIGRNAEALCAPADPRPSPFDHRAQQDGEILVAEHDLRRQDGSAVPVEVSSRRMPDGTYQCILRDISERRRGEADRLALEARLRQSQKMEAIGRLAGGVAHDFNNLLTAITGSLTLAMRDVPSEARAHRWLREVDNAAWRAAGLTRQLLAFGREQANAPQLVDLRTVVEGIRPMLARLIGEDIELRTTLPGSRCVAEVDQGQIEQVLLNLAANARDAMPDGGVLRIEVAPATQAAELRRVHPEAPPGRHVVLSVSDSGHGMTEDVRTRVFEPFFTTKPAGSGTGLGLALVYSAVQQNHGSIEVDSMPGSGTTFRIYLPETQADLAGAPACSEEAAVPRGSETILLVEDEAPVREVTTVQLDSLGYRVLSCPTGEAALATVQAHAGPVHLLLSDLVLPGMNGRELARRLAEARPGLKVLFTSGYGEDVAARQGALDPGAHFLEKPYTLAALARRVRESLAD
jgi:two-component system, cell cycle sensor histidine kinase and response regulator CckA